MTQKSLEKTIQELLKRKQLAVHDYFKGDTVRFGVVSDTQLGSLYERRDLLNLAYKTFKKEKITTVYHAGDLVDGDRIYRGHEYEVFTIGATNQANYVAECYPKFKGITTYFITGNHDLCYWWRSQVDIGEMISQKRPDLQYLGKELVDVRIGNGRKRVTMRIMHPGGGTAYAISWKSQKIVESLPGGKKPSILLLGHYHKAEYIFFRNVHVLQAGCFAAPTGIETKTGLKKICNIKKGDLVLTHKNRFRKVTKLFKRKYFMEWVKINFGRKNSDTSRITCTAEHPILVERGTRKWWLPARCVTEEDVVFVKSTKCKHCGILIPYYNKFCRDCNPSMIGAKHKPPKRKYNPECSNYKHQRQIIKFCQESRKKGRLIVPTGGLIVPDAIEFCDGKIIAHEIENSSRPNKRKYDVFPELSEFIDEVRWKIKKLKGNSQQNDYFIDKETGFIKVPVLKKTIFKHKFKSRTVYNFEVEEDNSYIASNVVVHNCLQDQTPFMARKPTPAHLGFWIVEFKVPKMNDVNRFKTELIPFYN